MVKKNISRKNKSSSAKSKKISIKEIIKNKKIIIIAISVIILTLIAVLIISLVKHPENSNNDDQNNTLQESKNGLKITLSDKKIDFVAKPVDYFSTMEDYITIEADNGLNNKDDTFILYYNVEKIDDKLISPYTKYAIMRSTDGSYYALFKTGTFNTDLSSEKLDLMTATIPAKSKYYYRLYTYVEKVNSDAEKLKGKKMTLSLETNINN